MATARRWGGMNKRSSRNTVETAATARWLEAEMTRLRQELHADAAMRRSRAGRG